MESVAEGKFNCVACGRVLKWKPELVGKKVKCPCGAVQIVAPPAEEIPMAAPVISAPPPAASSLESDSDMYDLASMEAHSKIAKPVGPVIAPIGRSISTPGSTNNKRGAINPPMKAGTLAYRAAGSTAVASADVELFNAELDEMWLPVGLVLMSTIILFGTPLMGGIRASALTLEIVRVGISMFSNVILTLIMMFFAVKFLDIAFGAPFPAMVKVAAIALAPSAVAGAVGRLLGGDWGATMFASMCLVPIASYVLFMVLFSLELGEAIWCVLIIYLVNQWLTTFLVLGLLSIAGYGI